MLRQIYFPLQSQLNKYTLYIFTCDQEAKTLTSNHAVTTALTPSGFKIYKHITEGIEPKWRDSCQGVIPFCPSISRATIKYY